MIEKVNIIVVDDEPISADELSDLIARTFSSRVDIDVRTAYNGASVLRMVAEYPCDILISDIQMPGMTGLKLAETLRKGYPDMFILFLTGFDDFNYAYEAFRQNAAHYLLKTEGDEAILTTIGKVIDRLLNRKQMITYIREAESRFSQMMPAYRRQLLMQVLLDVIPQDGLQELCDFDCDHLYVVIGRADNPSSHSAAKLKLTVLSTVEKILAGAMKESVIWSESFQLENSCAWVFSMRDCQRYTDTFFQLIRKARKHLDDQLSITLFFIVADEAVDAAHLQSKYVQLHGMLSHEILHGATGAAVIHPRSLSVNADQHQRELRQQLNQCLRNIRDGAFELLQKNIPPIIAYLHKTPRLENPFVDECSASLMGALLSHINQCGVYAVLETADQIAPRGTASWFEQIVNALLTESKKQQDYAIHSITKYVVSYIHDHISENIGTSMLAEVSGYSTGYLSRVFKQQMNVSIHEYITSARMDLARDLLKNTNLRVYEIASSCGYDNTAYFIKVFKTQIGQTPQEFKQDLLSGKTKATWEI